MRRLARLRALSPAERALLLRALALLWTARLGLWLLPLPTTRRLLGWLARSRARLAEVEWARRIAWATAVASEFVPRSTCLVQALAAEALLAGAGLPAELRIGVARDSSAFEAHAWVESRGTIVVGDGELERFTPLLSLGALSGTRSRGRS